jgi:hypothetical protein
MPARQPQCVTATSPLHDGTHALLPLSGRLIMLRLVVGSPASGGQRWLGLRRGRGYADPGRGEAVTATGGVAVVGAVP